MPFAADRLAAALAAIDPGWREGGACVALSGGLDSSVLLHAMAELARAQSFRLRAVHVDHGLQADSGAWAQACREACAAAGIPLQVISLRLQAPRGASLEAAAREARYAALAGELAPDERLLTAHHRDDQLETVLIQLLRGAGVAGLAAMPARARLGPGWQLRPLLDVDRAELRDFADRHGLTWCEDPMNEALRFDRGWLRARVLPAIRERWPSAATTVARSASHLAEASRLLDGLAAADAAGLVDDGRVVLAGLATSFARPAGQRAALVAAHAGLAAAGGRAARRRAAGLFLGAARRRAQPVLAGGRDPPLPRAALRGPAVAGAAASSSRGPHSSKFELGPGLGSFELVATEQGGLRSRRRPRSSCAFARVAKA